MNEESLPLGEWFWFKGKAVCGCTVRAFALLKTPSTPDEIANRIGGMYIQEDGEHNGEHSRLCQEKHPLVTPELYLDGNPRDWIGPDPE